MADSAVVCPPDPTTAVPEAADPHRKVHPVTHPVVRFAEELSPATIEVFGDDADIRHDDGTDRAALPSAVGTADALLVHSATQVDAEVFAAAPELKVVARAGGGLDNVDVPGATPAAAMVVHARTPN